MAEVVLEGVVAGFGGPPLLDRVQLALERGERLGLLGRNGAGKSTLLRIVSGERLADEGRVAKRPGLRIGTLAQDVPRDAEGTVGDWVRAGLHPDAAPWEAERDVDSVLSRLRLRGDLVARELSAGLKRRALLARALVANPDVLVLDEPTNHLELESILELEELLLQFPGAVLFVTHDRSFLRAVATGILELDRGKLTRHGPDYEQYLERREAALLAEERQRAEFDKKLAQEEAWIRRGVEARRTRNMGRVRALVALREERRVRRERAGTAAARLVEAERSGRLVIRAKGLCKQFGETTIAKGLDFELWRGDRVGLIGPNGSGKSTLISLLLGEAPPDGGEVHQGTNLTVGRFDQLGDSLDPERSIRENVAGDSDTVTVGGHSRHVLSYLADFLFHPSECRRPVRDLSGGERARVQLARLLARPVNLLVLDEPTNDLDLETLEVLEELLARYQGTLLLVSHDRAFLEATVTSTLVWEGPGRWVECVGGASEGLARAAAVARATRRAPPGKASGPAPSERPRPPAPAPARPRGLSFTQAHELERLPAAIEALEAEQAALFAALSDPEFFRRPKDQQAAAKAALAAKAKELESAMARWEELETLADAARRGDA